MTMTSEDVFEQSAYAVRFDWGLDGLVCLAPISDTVVIVDVLSFTTAVSIAVDRGATVYPYRFKEESATLFAESVDALLLNKRDEGGLSLSPTSLQQVESGQKLVLPSPNGSTLASTAREYGKWVVAGSLRNAQAVAQTVMESGKSVAVIAAGERWLNGNLRPALEDVLGAGAILSDANPCALSPEARSAVSVFRSVQENLLSTLLDCASGRELIARGYQEDVVMASRLNETGVVPVLVNGAFQAMDRRQNHVLPYSE
ncbi:hypothetical protein AYW79_12000 [Ferroacidibacillus organovorans]|uniref:Probable 2-phosphosulfolactate phosphatase n=2 Tax=Ferroacidibacillus organovorans TaxID=1765683 RepID=A0A853K7Z0_9BACL|nr:hypothetical protein AYJ22_12325 [Ferroacidibacillus organovorans]OAG93181.1 hypothetical protein AYW79_12000 [Ferroacidibacillus organovorans]